MSLVNTRRCRAAGTGAGSRPRVGERDGRLVFSWLGRYGSQEGLSDEKARQAPLSTSPLMTVSGLVSHVRWVGYSWFEVVFLGHEDQGPWTEEDPDREMRIAFDVPLAQLLDEFDAKPGITARRYNLLLKPVGGNSGRLGPASGSS